MEKNSNGNVVDEVIEQVEKEGKLKEKAIKKIKNDKDIKKYVSDLVTLIIAFILLLIILEVPEVVGYFYVESVSPLDVVYEVLYLVVLFVLLVRNYITLRKINSKQ